jgi:protein subunit release factor A
VPETEKNGRRHSSTVTVVFVGDVGDVEIQAEERDVREDRYRGSGAGGQHRNKTDSCVRLTHLPTGLIVTAEDSRSQWQNRQVAWERLNERLRQVEADRSRSSANAERFSQFDTSRCWVWCGWRDEVVSADGRRGSMRRALKGDLARLVAPQR